MPALSDSITDSMAALLGCLDLAVPDVCSFGWTVGEAYVPFDPDPDEQCADDDVMCSRVWLRVGGIATDSAGSGFGQTVQGDFSLNLEVGINRCFDIPEGGQAPTASEVLEAAAKSMDDMDRILCAVVNCQAFNDVVPLSWTPDGPLGGIYGGIWNFQVDIEV